MILIIWLLSWSLCFLGLGYLSWIKIQHQIRVYLLIVYNAAFLCGIFLIFPLLKTR